MKKSILYLILCILSFSCGAKDNFKGEEPVPAAKSSFNTDCIPDLNGEIESHEFPVQPGTASSYELSSGGIDINAAAKFWDLRTKGKKTTRISVLLKDKNTFKSLKGIEIPGSFVLLESHRPKLAQLFHKDAKNLFYHGISSKNQEDKIKFTRLFYEQPMPSLSFPIRLGDEQSFVRNIQAGSFEGLPFSAEDKIKIKVIGIGKLKLENLSFNQVLLIHSHFVRSLANGMKLQWFQYSFYAECYGEVARLVSFQDESNPAFTNAQEIRTLTF